MKKIILFLLLLVSGRLYAQQTGILYVSIYPFNAVIRLNDSLVHSPGFLSLKPGNYVVKAWAPEHALYEATVKIVADSTTTLRKNIPFAPAYVDFTHNLTSYKLNRISNVIVHKVIPPVLLIVETDIFYGLYNNMWKSQLTAKNNAISSLHWYNYSTTQSDLNKFQLQFDNYKADYNKYFSKRLKLDIVCGAVGALTIAWAIHTVPKSRKLVRPTYSEQPLLSFSPFFNPSGKNFGPAGVQIGLHF